MMIHCKKPAGTKVVYKVHKGRVQGAQRSCTRCTKVVYKVHIGRVQGAQKSCTQSIKIAAHVKKHETHKRATAGNVKCETKS